MDPIVGDFTLTSKTARNPPTPNYENPAIISTTFPRAIKQTEGYEISLKSIAHAPVKNLVRSEFDLVTWTITGGSWISSPVTYNLPSRFYESRADLLMEIYRILGALDDPPPMILYEKDGETTLKFTDSHAIDIHSDIFLNRPFKYKRFADSELTTVSRKKRTLDSDDMTMYKRKSVIRRKRDTDFEFHPYYHGQMRFDNRQAKVDRLKAIEKAVIDLDKHWHQVEKIYETVGLKEIQKAYGGWRAQMTRFVEWSRQKDSHDAVLLANNDKIKDFNAVLLANNEKIEDFQQKLDTLPSLIAKSSAIETEKNKRELDQLNSSIDQVVDLTNKLQEDQNRVLYRLGTKIDENHQDMRTVIEVLTKQLGHDSLQLMATDTSNFVSTKDKAIVRAKEVTVSSDPIVTTRLGFLYCNVIENSLINNKESRLLCIFPIISKRGYSFYEVRESIYKPISVLQFSTITFTILDSEGDLVEFSLEGDQLTNIGDRKRKYPTLVNLHIQKRL